MHPATHAPSVTPPAGARHASWSELFFDLVAVARTMFGGPGR
ncbi:hypothetical protein [Streptomyces sp. NPDC057690]